MEESLLSFDADRQFRRHAACRRDGQQFRITRDTCTAVYAQSVVAARDDKDQSDVVDSREDFFIPSNRLFPSRSGMMIRFSSSAFTKPAASPFGETSHVASDPAVAINRKGERVLPNLLLVTCA
jgi:hypothetical protein